MSLLSIHEGRTQYKPPPLIDKGDVRGRWHRCEINKRSDLSLAPMTEGVPHLHESITILLICQPFHRHNIDSNYRYFTYAAVPLPFTRIPEDRRFLSFI